MLTRFEKFKALCLENKRLRTGFAKSKIDGGGKTHSELLIGRLYPFRYFFIQKNYHNGPFAMFNNEIIAKLQSRFDSLVQTLPEEDIELWFARDLQEPLGYVRWENFSYHHYACQRCNCCGHINNGLKLSDRIWECPACKKTLDRDINAAKNILTVGLAGLAFGENGRLCNNNLLQSCSL